MKMHPPPLNDVYFACTATLDGSRGGGPAPQAQLAAHRDPKYYRPATRVRLSVNTIRISNKRTTIEELRNLSPSRAVRLRGVVSGGNDIVQNLNVLTSFTRHRTCGYNSLS
ncbi:hypothetical protein EVAR_21641_1 [Eumeta japonica]|uniref:Uncharacterized protein n=1 Tax=Eumeta variegata TaxID=151549 RepID=A0A4C1VFA0_EUMVA|nr:hypothetical protein EVAR_21641_1 [Eumeta japonica]